MLVNIISGTQSDEKDTVIKNEEFVQKKNRVTNFSKFLQLREKNNFIF